jgi:hypothetical protein
MFSGRFLYYLKPIAFNPEYNLSLEDEEGFGIYHRISDMIYAYLKRTNDSLRDYWGHVIIEHDSSSDVEEATIEIDAPKNLLTFLVCRNVYPGDSVKIVSYIGSIDYIKHEDENGGTVQHEFKLTFDFPFETIMQELVDSGGSYSILLKINPT